MSKIKQVYMFAEELLAEAEDGAIDFDEAYETMLKEYPMLSMNNIEAIFNEVMKNDCVL